MKYQLLLLKRMVEDICMYPLILLGRWMAKQRPLPQEYEVFYFFPFYHTGGAEKVHAQIAQATGNPNCIIFFTRKSQDAGFKKLFEKSGCAIRDISNYTGNKWLYFVNIFFRGLVSGYINKQQQAPLVFNGQSNFGYKISPWISSKSRQIELIHSVSNFSYIRIPFLPFISQTVMISTIKIQEHLKIYRRYGVPHCFDSRIQFIMNGIELPATKSLLKVQASPYIVLYVGRGTPEKRVELIATIASIIKIQEPGIRFEFLGDVQQAIPDADKSVCKFWGNQMIPL